VRRLRIPLAVFAALAVTVAVAAATPYGQVAHNPANRLAAKPIDDYRYDRAHHCYRRPSRGANAMVSWLTHNARGQFWGIMRCERLSRDSLSLHSEGRAIDWHLDARRPAERRAAERLIKRLLAPDSEGNAHALARRMGIQEIIFNCRSWWSGSEGMEPYSLCVDRKGRKRKRVNATLAHRDHVHIGLSRAGARMRTSFWTRGR